jgi:hypothetical protein
VAAHESTPIGEVMEHTDGLRSYTGDVVLLVIGGASTAGSKQYKIWLYERGINDAPANGMVCAIVNEHDLRSRTDWQLGDLVKEMIRRARSATGNYGTLFQLYICELDEAGEEVGTVASKWLDEVHALGAETALGELVRTMYQATSRPGVVAAYWSRHRGEQRPRRLGEDSKLPSVVRGREADSKRMRQERRPS